MNPKKRLAVAQAQRELDPKTHEMTLRMHGVIKGIIMGSPPFESYCLGIRLSGGMYISPIAH